jgi:hypothetical protein
MSSFQSFLRQGSALILAGVPILAPAADWPTPPTIDSPAAAHEPAMRAELHDPAWAGAAVLSPLTASFGNPAGAVLPKTTIRLLWSPRALYIRFEAEDSNVVVPYTERDADHFKGDVAEVFIDPTGAQHVWYEFEVTPHNGVYDAIHLCTAAPHSGADGVLDKIILDRNLWTFKTWDCAGLRTAAREIPGGWIVEMAISPEILRSTGESAFHAGSLRANFLRYDVNKNIPPVRLLMNWSEVVFGRPHRSPARMGTIHLLP